MSLSEDEKLKLRLLGLLDDEDDALQAQPERVAATRRELLQKRRSYLSKRMGSRSTPVATKGRSTAVRGLGIAAVGIFALCSFFWVSGAKATQARQHQRYARQLLGSMSDFYCEDLVVLNSIATQSEDLLPASSSLGFNAEEWKQLQASSMAVRCLFTARLGQLELSSEQLLAAIHLSSLASVDTAYSESSLLFELCRGKAAQVVGEAYADTNRVEDRSRYYEDAVRGLELAYEQAKAARFLSIEESNLICAGVMLDIARTRMKVAPPEHLRNEEPLTYDVVDNALALATQHLDAIHRREQEWWSQAIRLEAYKVLIKSRSIHRQPQALDVYQKLVVDAQQLLAEIPTWSSDPSRMHYLNGLNAELAIYLANVADAIEYSATDEQSVALKDELLALRQKVSSLLSNIPVHARTNRLEINHLVNTARRMHLRCRAAIFSNRLESEWSAIQQDAVSLDIAIGDVLFANIPQLRPENRIIAAMVLGQADTPEFDEYWNKLEPEFTEQILTTILGIAQHTGKTL